MNKKQKMLITILFIIVLLFSLAMPLIAYGTERDSVICHNPDGPHPKTLIVSKGPNRAAHWNHGDHLGACQPPLVN